MAGGEQHVGPEFAGEFHPFLLADGGADRDVDEDVVPHADQHVGVAGHRGVDGVAGHLVAEQAVGRVGRHAADEVARVDVLERDRDVLLLEVLADLVAEEDADVLVVLVAGGVARAVAARRRGAGRRPSATAITACLLCRMRSLSAGRKPFGPSSGKAISGTRQKLTSWLASVAPAAMKPASRPISFTRPMPFGAPFASTWAQHIACCAISSAVAKPNVRKTYFDVVVDRLGDADDGDLESAAGDLFVDGVGAALGAVAADAERAC